MRKPEIAIIGGGPAGLSAAFHLTDDERWSDRIGGITVYQMGWRLGGKGATGRDANRGGRLEEHGIHGFCRFYFNTFRMMGRAYAELEPKNRALLPVKTMQDAFIGSSLTLGVEHVGEKWAMRPTHLPHFPGVPWSSGAFDDPDPVEIGRRILEQMLRRGRRGPLTSLDSTDLVPDDDKEALAAAAAIDHALGDALLASALVIGELETVVEPQLAAWTMLLAQIKPAFGSLFQPAIEAAGQTGNVGAYGALTSLDLYAALLSGLIADGILLPGRDLDAFDGEDYRGWLRRNGASSETLKSSSVYTIANMLFAYPGGDSSRDPALSAAAWLGWMLRTLSGRGEYFYLMAAGTGETVILPLYLLLKQRGVRFKFFHRLTGIESAHGAGSDLVVEKLIFERQARPNDGEYDPVDRPSSVDFGVWPNGPLVDQLQNAKLGRDYEAWEDGRHEETCSIERGNGFDYAVWAIPPSMIPVVGDAALQQRWKPVMDLLPTTATQAAQIWLVKPTVELGPRCGYPERYASASFPNPLNGMVSFDDILCFEGWGKGGPLGLFYLCGALAPEQPPTEATRAREHERVRKAALDTLDLIGHFFPHALPQHPDPAHPKQIDFDLLYALPASGHNGPARILDQYVRANTRPTEAYVQAPANSVGGRLDPWDSYYTNLVPAGDWIYTGINVGAFESAVTGGKLAAFALTGLPVVGDIEAYSFFHPRAAERAAEAVRSGRLPRIR